MYVAYCTDYTDGRAMPQRVAHLDAHLRYIESILDRLAVAGPTRDAHGVVNGSVLIYRVSSAEEARRLIEDDPYSKVPIWETIDIRPFAAVVGDWVGGKRWGNPEDILRQQ